MDATTLRAIGLGAIIALAPASCTAPPAPSDAPSESLAARIDPVFARWDSRETPGCAVAVVLDGEIVHARGYGMADLERGVPIAPRTVFDIGSTSKQFTAACIGLLVQDGALALDDSVKRHVPELPDYASAITIRHLLHHTSGLRDYLDLLAFAGRSTEDWTTPGQALALLARQSALDFEPGALHRYSNSNYFLLSLIVERVSKKSFAQFARERIFEPLGMAHTHVHDDHTRLVPDRAIGYAPRPEGGFALAMSDYEQTGDGAVLTTVEDLARWDANFETRSVGGDALQQFLHERGRLNDGREIDYARGLTVDTFCGVRRVCHGGAWAGYRAQIMRFPDQRLTVICLANSAAIDPSDPCVKVAFRLIGEELQTDDAAPPRPRDGEPSEEPAPALSPEELAAYAGTYWSDELAAESIVELRDGQLFIGTLGAVIVPLAPLGDERFEVAGAWLAFERDDSGQVSGFALSSFRARGVRFERR